MESLVVGMSSCADGEPAIWVIARKKKLDSPVEWRVQTKSRSKFLEFVLDEYQVDATNFSKNWLFGFNYCGDRFPWGSSDRLF